ncbi:hypothetical protein DSO57_1038917 [Entomophthora muscae]|uniref:Uncharacterized protein n=1 Tax=Entomophthora muscae TaxID=34485 RepID=A0ACC2S0L6_9FUNG|nr:hypothetical protein DSO57_1038917 [Entomophthora muscae]
MNYNLQPSNFKMLTSSTEKSFKVKGVSNTDNFSNKDVSVAADNPQLTRNGMDQNREDPQDTL